MLHDGLGVHIGITLLPRILDIRFEAGQWTGSLAVLLKPIQRRTNLQRRCAQATRIGNGLI